MVCGGSVLTLAAHCVWTGLRWWSAGTTVTPGSAAGCLAWTSTPSRASRRCRSGPSLWWSTPSRVSRERYGLAPAVGLVSPAVSMSCFLSGYELLSLSLWWSFHSVCSLSFFHSVCSLSFFLSLALFHLLNSYQIRDKEMHSYSCVQYIGQLHQSR